MKINSESYVAQAETWIAEASTPREGRDGEYLVYSKLELANNLIQLEQAKQLTRIANSLNQIAMRFRL
jgi:hypothetical protein